MDYVLRTFDISKKYHSNQVLNKVNMNIARGDIYGFVGENGSGKTTIIRLITGLISPNEGYVELFGIPSTSPEITKARRKVGAIVESPSIYRNMSAKDNLLMQSTILGINDEEKIKRTLADVGLFELYNNSKKANNFSLGMRQRLGIAMALLGDPEFIILDEPMNGLDPAGIVEIRELILKLNRERNITFLISSHILNELALVATKYGIISHGTLLKEISSEELEHECRPSIIIETSNPEALWALLSNKIPSEDLSHLVNGVRIIGNLNLNALLKDVLDNGIEILSINCQKTNIENYYLSVIGGNHHA